MLSFFGEETGNSTMSNIVTRKGPIGEDSKKHSDSPVKEMKKKMAANAEKEKQAAEKEKVEKSNTTAKQAEKANQSDKAERAHKKDKSADKAVDKTETRDKSVEKVGDKHKPTEKVAEKSDQKSTEKNVEKVEKKADKGDKKEKAEKKEGPIVQIEKTKEESKENGKADTPDKQKRDSSKAKQNGARVNGGGEPDGQSTVSSEDDDEDEDRLFPELSYEDEDVELFEPPTPEGPSRSYTRRSQVKASRTPETPRPASDKQTDKDYVPEEPKESLIVKLKEAPSDRKLRSSNSPKPQDKAEKAQDKNDDKNTESFEKTENVNDESKIENKPESEVAIEENEEEARKPDTNYSKSRVKVSPYRRSIRLADQTATSLQANYTGNNTTMEMDITESSLTFEEPSGVESPYLSGLRNIRGRRSYKPLKEMTLRNIGVNTSIRSTPGASISDTSRPTGTVVGRKRKPEATETNEEDSNRDSNESRGKRAKLLERLGGLARPFRFSSAASDRLCVESTAEIVGINTDLPLSAPVAAADTLDPESLKHATPLPARAPALPDAHRDKRCSIM
ncbi:unnamed protein product [Leptosia nina]|uniref:Uncharacterized protein n=1 Tax=Leptosia nina TaxID=320188 RepID=A0AAV1IYT4_9NEOP